MIEQLIIVFFIFAFGGWIIELVFRSVYERRIVNPGFHRGPWLPVYGITGLVIFLVSSILAEHSLYLRMVVYFVLCTALEFSAGVFLERVFHRRYWDYSENRFNFKGLICPLYSGAWVVISVTVEYFILPHLLTGLSALSHEKILIADAVLSGIFITDFLYSGGILSRDNYRKLKDLFS